MNGKHIFSTNYLLYRKEVMKEKGKLKSIFTKSIHAGEDRARYADSITTPIVQSSTYSFKDSKEIEAYTKNDKKRYEYGRYGNPTEKVAERRLAELDGAEEALMFSSGMMAIATTILALVQSGDHIVITDDCYGKTLEFCRSYLKRFGIECTIVPFGDYEVLDAAIKKIHVLFFQNRRPIRISMYLIWSNSNKSVTDTKSSLSLIRHLPRRSTSGRSITE